MGPLGQVEVLTGDVIRSTTLPPERRQELPPLLEQAYKSFQKGRVAALPYGIDVFRGDSWQVLVSEPGVGLALAVYLRAWIRERLDTDVRIGIALDEPSHVVEDRITESDGPAFRSSGRALEQLSRHYRLHYAVPAHRSAHGLHQLLADACTDTIDAAAQRWTQAQAQSITHVLLRYPDEPLQKEIAAEWRPEPITQPTVNGHLRAAGWGWIQRALKRHRLLIEQITG